MTAVMEASMNGQDLKDALEGAKLYIEQHVDELNKLNIFPVPDGDTGVNMFLTISSAVEEVKKAGFSAGEVAALAARGALLGARGNSGVILSQIMKGVAKGLEGREVFSFADFAHALHFASEQAYKVVDKPVEGTILTVIREVSEEATKVAEKKTGFVRAINSVVLKAGRTVKKTPDMLPVLKEAGVVDAGAKGLYYFFKGMESSICRSSDVGRSRKKAPVKFSVKKNSPNIKRAYGFDVQFLLEGKDLPVEEIKQRVIAAGECPLVVGDETLLKVHVHTMDPDDILNYARTKGEMSDIVVEDMDAQVEERS